MTATSKLIGITACGGKSTRMGQDKSLLRYHRLPQCYHVFEMLNKCCEATFISCNVEQKCGFDLRYPVIVDEPGVSNAGPLTALLSAMKACPGDNILFIGCDYPYLRNEDISNFLACISKAMEKPAAFYNSDAQVYIPLLGYYPANSEKLLRAGISDANFSLQRFLKTEKATQFIPANQDAMMSVDDPEMMAQVKLRLAKSVQTTCTN